MGGILITKNKGDIVGEVNKKVWCILDEESGELKKTLSTVKTKEEQENYKLIKQENLVQKLNNKGGIFMGEVMNLRHSRVYQGRVYPLSWTYAGYMSALERTINKNNNCISHEPDKRGYRKEMSSNDIAEYLNIDRSTKNRFIKEAKSKGVIAEITKEVNDLTKTYFVINPCYTFNGSYLDYWTFKIFEDDSTFKKLITEYHREQVNRIELLS